MIKTVWLNGFEDLSDSHYIRRKVFIGEQGVPEKLEMDELDGECMHIVLYSDGKPAGTGRVLLSGDDFILGRIAVLPEFRGQRLGDLIVRLMIRKAYLSGGVKQHVHAQLSARGFYEKLGFTACGDIYTDAGMEHIDMVHFGDVSGNC